MLFNSYAFVFAFLPLSLLIHHSLRRQGLARESIFALTKWKVFSCTDGNNAWYVERVRGKTITVPHVTTPNGRMTPRITASARSLFAGILVVLAIDAAPAATDEPGLPILVYHEIRDSTVTPSDGPTAISLARFESQMRYLHEHAYVTLSTIEAVDFIKGNAAMSTKKIVAIHFDDGWKSAQLALPVLDRYGFKAAFWIIPGTGIGWPHMDWAELQALGRNSRYEVLSHTMTHPWREGETLPDWVNGRVFGKGLEQARWELVESRRLLMEKLQTAVPYLAWPRGLYDDTLIRLATVHLARARRATND